MTLLLTETAEMQVAAASGGGLWISKAQAQQATGWELQPQGFCKGDVCVPIPSASASDYVRGDKVNISAFWDLLGNPSASSAQGDVWCLGEGAAMRNDELLSLDAPDFTLPDFSGKPHSLSDFRRKRVLLITWASW
jgi:hypothetical protein